jgi:hypothetical protein
MTCEYCGGRGWTGNPESPDSCECGRVLDEMRFDLTTETGVWNVVATKWSDESCSVEASRNAGSPYMVVTEDYELTYSEPPTLLRVVSDLDDAVISCAEIAAERAIERAWSV